VGIVYQVNVAPMRQRNLVGAELIRAVFERAAYGCRLFCCWCAQDIAANRFWEAMGFVPLAYRAGSAAKGRVHIFWQKRIRAGDVSTPFWYPSKTNSGSIREDRIVFPIPPGTHWADAKPILLPGEEAGAGGAMALPAPAKRPKPQPKARLVEKRNEVARNGMWFDVPKQGEPIATEKPPREKKPKAKHDARMVSAARELRDRYLEQYNSGRCLPAANGKYDVARLPAAAGEVVEVRKLAQQRAVLALPAA